MAISFVAAGTVATGANPTVTVPTGYAQDDFLIIVTAGTATTTTPTDWTLISAQGAGQFITTFYKFANASEASVALTNAGTTTKAVMMAYRGVGLFDVVSAYTTATATTLATATQTTLLANDYVLSIYANASGAARTWTAPASTTARVNSATTTTVRGLLIVDEAKATAGLTTARTATISASSTLAAVSISIRQPQTLYWRGGTGTWNTTTKTNWSLTSGGTGSVAVPNELDNVIFNTLSNTGTTAFTVTLSAAICKNFTIDPANPIDANMTLAGGTSTLFIYGSVDWSGDNATLLWTGTPTITFAATTTGETLTWSSSVVSNASIVFDGLGGAWTTTNFLYGDSSSLTLTNGSLTVDTSGSIQVRTFASNNSNTRSLIFNANAFINVLPTISSTPVDFTTITNLTLTNAFFYVSPQTTSLTLTVQSNSGFTETTAPTIYIFSYASAITINGNAKDLTFDAGTLGASTVANTAITIYGNLLVFYTGYTFTSGTNAWTFASITAQTITSSGRTLNFPVTFDGVGGSWQLQDAMTVSSARTVTLTNGTLDLNGFNLTCGAFASTNTNTRTIAFGTGQIYVIALNVLVFDTRTSTGLTITGTPVVNLTGSGTAGQTRTIYVGSIAGGSSAVAVSMNITAGADLISFSAGSYLNNLAFSSFTGTSAIAVNIYGNLTLASGMSAPTSASGITFGATSGTKTITTNGVTIDQQTTFDGVGGTWQLVGALTVGVNRTVTLTNGTLDLNNFNLTAGAFASNNSNTRTLAYGTGQIYVIAINVTVFSMGTVTGLTVTGTPAVNVTGSGTAGQTRTITIGNTAGGSSAIATSLSVTAGADTISVGGGSYINNLTYSSFTGTANNISQNIYGNLTLSSGMTVGTTTAGCTFAATSGTKTITTNGVTLDQPITFNGVGGTWQLQDAFITGSTNGSVTLTNGTLDLNNNNLTSRIFSSSNSNTRTITSGTGQFYLTGNGTTIWTTATPTGLTYTTAPTVNATYTGSTGTRTLTNCSTGGNLSNQAINLNITAGTDIITAGTTSVHKNVNFTGYAGASTFTGYVTGNLTLSATMTITSASTLYIVDPNVSTQTITSNGCTIDNPVNSGYSTGTVTGASGTGSTATLTFASTTVIAFPVGSTIQVTGMNPSGYNGTYTVTASTITSVSYASTQTGAFVTGGVVRIGTSTTLSGNLTLGATRGFNLIMGTLALGTSNLTSNSFTSNIGVTRSISTSTGQIYSGNTTGGTLVNISDATGYTQTGQVIFNYTGAGSGGIRGFSFGTSGGATETNSPSLVVSNGSDAILVNYQGGLKDLTFTSGYTGTFIARTYVYGNLSIASGVTSTVGGDGNPLIMSGTSGTKTVTTNGCVIDQPFYIDGAGGSWQLLDSLSLATLRSLRVTNGSFDANGFNVTCNAVQSGYTTTRSIIMGTGTWTLSGTGAVWSTSPSTNLTFSGASSTIVLQDTSTTARTFTSGTGLVYGNLIFSGSNIVTTTFSSAQTWGTWSSTKTVPFTITLISGNTYTLGDWTISGSAGNLVTLNASTAGTRATLSKSSGTVSVDYLDIKDSNATGGATWYAGANSVNSGNNLGWIFSAIVTSIINFFAFFNGA